MSDKRILIVDDEAAVRHMIAFSLSRHGFQIEQADDAVAAHRCVKQRRPDLALVDWMLPGTSGLEFTSALRANSGTSQIPVLMLTARADEHDKVLALDAGADDYITKPFSARELVARIHAVLRRSLSSDPKGVIRANGLSLDTASRRVSVEDQVVTIGPMDFKLLSFLMANPERAYSRTQLLSRVWGARSHIEARSVDVQVSRLRKLLQPFRCDAYIQTVHGMGYRFSVRED